MRRRAMPAVSILSAFALLGLPAIFAAGQARTGKTLDIYVVDVEGGNATLFVAPSGESLLIDTGNGGAAAPRDAGRIVAAARDAGVTRIDHLVTTHWHGDHVGGLGEFATRMPIRHFIDHGPNVQPGPGIDEFLRDAYPKLYEKGTHTVAKPGDSIAVAGLEVRVVSSAGQVLATPLPGAGKPNPYCAAFKPTGNSAEDAQSVGTYVRYGQFRALHPGDLPTTKEFELMCPNSRIDAVDVLLGLHHGQDTSNSEVLVHAIRPRVAIMNNGPKKGGEAETMKTVRSSPGLLDFWQLHTSLNAPQANMPVAMIANLDESAAHAVKLSAQRDGSFSVTNTRTGETRRYGPR